ncbi:MAG TPA: hypothetical protein DD000_05780 [Cyanobacteria bacterium UBA11166]|nr:hypothetical protein [Cyanobacteria bacterium UBA11166]
MNYRRLICIVSSLACLAVLIAEGYQPRKAMAEFAGYLYAQQYNWVTYNLAPGSYRLEASTWLNLGDVDIEVYDSTRQNLLFKSNKLGGEIINFTVNRGGDFHIKYKMLLCANPAGACGVDIKAIGQ